MVMAVPMVWALAVDPEKESNIGELLASALDRRLVSRPGS